MPASSSIIKTPLKTSLAQGVIDDVQHGRSKLYYFLGKTLEWNPVASTDSSQYPKDTYNYELDTRNNIITYRKVLPTDVAYVVRRIDWESGTVYDQYDDRYQQSTLIGSGSITSSTSSATITGTSSFFSSEISVGDIIKTSSGVEIGTVASIASNTSLTLESNALVTVTNSFYEYVHTVAASSGATSLQTANYYVMTDLYNVYKCLNNNLGAASTTKPTGTSSSPVITADGYIWKFMYNVPAALRNKFLTEAVIPVTTAVRNQYYSSGEISNVTIVEGGSSYSATPTLTVTGDGFVANNPYIISGITITEAGSGYTSAPSLTVSAPTVISGSESTATMTSTISGDEVNGVTITDAGFGYEAAPTITVDEPFTATVWTELTTLLLGVYVKYEGNYYEVTVGGTTATTAPTHTSGALTDGTAELTYVGTIAVITPVLTKTEATMTATVVAGVITDVTVTDGGTGYTYANITISDSTGSGADLTVDLSQGDLDTIQSNVELLAVDGAIHHIVVETAGSGYSGVPTVTISGDGSGATATANLSSTGTLESITMTDVGSGYTYATVSISGGGSGATARAIISPQGGHGKNAVYELAASSLSIYTTIAVERNQGFILDNDYRQLGIIKNPKVFDRTTTFAANNGSTCYVVHGTINTADFTNDMLINIVGETAEYRIVAVESTKALIQSLSNDTPSISDVFENADGDTFAVTSVTNPTVDKYSGDLWFIDNKNAFTPTSTQSITARSILDF